MPSIRSGKQLVYDPEGAFQSSQFTLPHFDDGPPALFEKLPISSITSHVRIELIGPEALVRCRGGRSRATWMSMPEAAVHEHSKA